MDKKRILVIGGASIKALEFIKQKLDLGIEVVCLDNLSSSDINNIEKFKSYKNFIFIEHDINIPFFIEVDEVYSFINNTNDKIKDNIRMLIEKNKIEEDNIKTISIIGTGYVGLTFASILSNIGYKVYTVDIDENKINTVKSGKSYFFEPGLDRFIEIGIKSGNLIPTTSYKDAIPESDVVFICVGTPATEDGSSDLSYVFESAKEIALNAKKDLIVVQKSTVPVKTSRETKRILDKNNTNGVNIEILSNPEFLREGSAIFDTLFFDRVVIGGKKEASLKVAEIYSKIDDFARTLDIKEFNEYAFLNISSKYIENIPEFSKRLVLIDNIESSELIKVTSNSFLALKIAFANTVARICDKTGADSKSVFDGVGMDNRIGRAFLYPGLGYGGDCFPKDVAGMIDTASSFDVNFGILHEVVNVNKTQTYFVIDKIKRMIGTDDLHDVKIAVLGLSFKAGTSDIRKSPSIRLIDKLLKQGAVIKAFDPRAIDNSKKVLEHNNLEYADNIEDVFDGVDIIVVATEWKEFIDFDYSNIINKMNKPIFLDVKGIMDLEKMRKIGFKIERI